MKIPKYPGFTFEIREGESGNVTASATIRKDTPQGGSEDDIMGITGDRRHVVRQLVRWRRQVFGRK